MKIEVSLNKKTLKMLDDICTNSEISRSKMLTIAVVSLDDHYKKRRDKIVKRATHAIEYGGRNEARER